MFLSDKIDRDTDSLSEQLDGDNESSESELNTTSDDNDWCPVTIVDGDLIRYLNLPLSVQNPSHPTDGPETCPKPRTSVQSSCE